MALATGTEAVTAVVSACTETENNYLKAPQVKELFDDMMVCRGSTDPSSCRRETQTKYEELSRKQGGGKLLYGCKADGEGVCERQFSEVQAGSKALGALGKMDWTSEELAILDPLTQLNYDEDRVADHAWRQSLHADSGITGGILLGGLAGLTTAKTELTVVKAETQLAEKVAKTKTFVGNEINLVDGFYQAEKSAFKFSEYYYNKLWSTGRGAPFLQAEEVINTAKTISPDRMIGFNRYVNDAFEMIYNPTTKEVWHLQPLRK